MSHSGAGGATTTPSRDNMTHLSLTGAAAIEQTASEEPPMLALPPELQKTIVAYLTSYTDMKSACLVCKQLNVVATPYLYRKMEITGQFMRGDRFKAATTTRNPGLASVNTVRIVCPYSTSSKIGQEACLLLSTIPRNSLTRFELPMPTSPRVARDIFHCVRLKQCNFDNHQYDSIRDLNGDLGAFAADADHLARVKHLRICIWDPRDSEQATAVLESMHELTSVDVDIRKNDAEVNRIALGLDFRALSFNHERSWIRSLRLDAIDFDRGTFPGLPGAQNLKHLQLVCCSSYDLFLQELTALSLNLDTLTIEEAGNGGGSFGTHANNFIRSLSSLERVRLTLEADFERVRRLLDWSALHGCASVLRSLKLQYHSVLAPYPSDENVLDFRRFCQKASSLEQLSISGIDLPMENFGDVYIHGSLEQFLDCIRTASALVVLKLTMWVSHNTIPLSHGASIETHMKRAQDLAQSREHLVKRTADKIFSTLVSTCPRLKVVVIETAWEYGRADYAVRAFLKSKQTNLYGRTTVVGMPVEPHMVKYHELCSDILDPDRFVFA